jgi:CubicO group peptidase (beta-lactamase class C family)
MSSFRDVQAWVAEQLPALIDKYQVPGAAVAVLADGEVFDAAAGILSKATGVEATPD